MGKERPTKTAVTALGAETVAGGTGGRGPFGAVSPRFCTAGEVGKGPLVVARREVVRELGD